MQATLKAVADLVTSKGTTLTKILSAVTGAVAWLNRQSYGAETKSAVRNLSFTVGGLPNFGRSGGSLTISKESGSFTVFGSTSGNDRFAMTLDGLVKAASELSENDESDVEQAEQDAADAEAEAEEAAQALADAQAAAEAAKVAAEAAKAKIAAAKAASESRSGLRSSLRKFVSA